MKSILLTLFFGINIIYGDCQIDSNSVDKLNKRLDSDSTLVYITIISSKKLSNFFPQKKFNKFYDKDDQIFNDTLTIDGKNLRDWLYYYFKESRREGYILNVIDLWFDNSNIINSIDTGFPIIETEEILYNDKKSRHLFNRFLDGPGQSWESLSTHELYELFIDVMKFLEIMTPKERSDFFEELIAIDRKLKSKLNKELNSQNN